MGPFLLKRFATFLATLMVASLVVFWVLELLPGNAAEVILGDTATPESVAAMKTKLGLDRPATQRQNPKHHERRHHQGGQKSGKSLEQKGTHRDR